MTLLVCRIALLFTCATAFQVQKVTTDAPDVTTACFPELSAGTAAFRLQSCTLSFDGTITTEGLFHRNKESLVYVCAKTGAEAGRCPMRLLRYDPNTRQRYKAWSWGDSGRALPGPFTTKNTGVFTNDWCECSTSSAFFCPVLFQCCS